MRNFCALACVLALSGCAWLGFGDDSETVSTSETQAAEAAPAREATAATPSKVETTVKKAAPAKSAKVAKGAKNEATIKAELDVMGKKLAAQSARTLLPNKSKPDYRQAGGVWIASYIDVDANNVTTEMRPGANGQYVGFIRYQERFMECRGATRQAAMSGGNCQQVKTRNLNELIRYDGKAWQD